MISIDKFPQLKNLPWLSNAMSTIPVDISENCGVEKIVQLILQNEKKAIEEGTGTLYGEILNSNDSVKCIIDRRKPYKTEESKACADLLLYRMVDATAFSKGHVSTCSTVRRGKFPTLSIPGWPKFCNGWPRFVQEAGNSLYEVIHEPKESNPNTLPDVALRHYQSLRRRVKKMAHNKMLINFEVVAMHLSTLMQGKDYPDELSDLAEMLDVNLQDLTEICSRNGTRGLQFPLHLALAVSPCALFMQTLLHKQQIGRHKLVEIWQSMGGSRPELLISIERRLWETILDISGSASEGTVEMLKSAFQEIHGLVGSDAVNVAEIDWFDPHHKENEDDLNGIPEATSSSTSLADALKRLTVDKGPNAPVASADANQKGYSLRTVNRPTGSSTSETIHVGTRLHLKRPLSPESSSGKIDLGKVRQLCVSGKMYELIDLTVDQADSQEKTLLSFETKAKRVAGPPRLLYDAFGEALTYTPEFHHKTHMAKVTELIDRVEQDYHSTGKPLHLADPSRSLFRIISLHDFNRMSDDQIQDLHARSHVLVTGIPEEQFGFDAEGMETLAPPDRVVTIQEDYSIPVKKNLNSRRRQGTTTDLLNSFESPTGKILNSLDFPQDDGSNPPMSISSDLVAFRAMACHGAPEEYPTATFRWGLAATEGAFSSFHIDSDGVGTYVSCINQNGAKWWVIVGPKDKSRMSSSFVRFKETYEFYVAFGADPNELGDVQVEAVLLKPGTRL